MNRLFSSLFNWTGLALLVFTVQITNLGADSLWKTETSASMFADKKAHAVGDVLTILIQENNGATRANNTTTSKKSSANASITSFLYGPTASGLLTKAGQYPALNYANDNEFNGGGSINNSETITARLTVRVIDVMPNGNMVVEGRRRTSFSGEKMDAILRGTVRYDDIAANNTLYSYNVADATIQFVSSGTITDTQRKGWFMRVWDKIDPL
jgi:flagellar L-ring protein precursor FlgH